MSELKDKLVTVGSMNDLKDYGDKTYAKKDEVVGGSVSDWNINDENTDGYIKNRPFYEGEDTITESWEIDNNSGNKIQNNIISTNDKFHIINSFNIKCLKCFLKPESTKGFLDSVKSKEDILKTPFYYDIIEEPKINSQEEYNAWQDTLKSIQKKDYNKEENRIKVYFDKELTVTTIYNGEENDNKNFSFKKGDTLTYHLLTSNIDIEKSEILQSTFTGNNIPINNYNISNIMFKNIEFINNNKEAFILCYSIECSNSLVESQVIELPFFSSNTLYTINFVEDNKIEKSENGNYYKYFPNFNFIFLNKIFKTEKYIKKIDNKFLDIKWNDIEDKPFGKNLIYNLNLSNASMSIQSINNIDYLLSEYLNLIPSSMYKMNKIISEKEDIKKIQLYYMITHEELIDFRNYSFKDLENYLQVTNLSDEITITTTCNSYQDISNYSEIKLELLTSNLDLENSKIFAKSINCQDYKNMFDEIKLIDETKPAFILVYSVSDKNNNMFREGQSFVFSKPNDSKISFSFIYYGHYLLNTVYTTIPTEYLPQSTGKIVKSQFCNQDGVYGYSEIFNTINYNDNNDNYSNENVADAFYAHAEGRNTQTNMDCSHVEGANNIIRNKGGNSYSGSSHAEGSGNVIIGGSESHVEGANNIVKGNYSHGEGYNTITIGNTQHVSGRYNIDNKDSLVIVGNGEKKYSNSPPIYSNAYELDKDGNAWFAGDIYTGTIETNNYRSPSYSFNKSYKRLATEEYVDRMTCETKKAFILSTVLKMKSYTNRNIQSTENGLNFDFNAFEVNYSESEYNLYNKLYSVFGQKTYYLTSNNNSYYETDEEINEKIKTVINFGDCTWKTLTYSPERQAKEASSYAYIVKGMNSDSMSLDFCIYSFNIENPSSVLTDDFIYSYTYDISSFMVTDNVKLIDETKPAFFFAVPLRYNKSEYSWESDPFFSYAKFNTLVMIFNNSSLDLKEVKNNNFTISEKVETYIKTPINTDYIKNLISESVGTSTSDKHSVDEEGNAWYAGDIYVGGYSGTQKDEGSQRVVTEDFLREFIKKLKIVDGQIVFDE